MRITNYQIKEHEGKDFEKPKFCFDLQVKELKKRLILTLKFELKELILFIIEFNFLRGF